MKLNKEVDQKQAVIYVRVSTKEQVDEGNSLVTQERICREYAEKNFYKVIGVFIEQGESAKTADRTELQRLLKFCAIKKNEINAIIIYRLDRLSRNTDDYSQIRLLLKRYGVEIKSTSEYFENTPVGRFMENTMANIAQFDNDIRAERSVNGMRDAAREGRYVWCAPIGYDNTKVNGKSTITPNPIMAPLVRKAFEMIASMVYPTEEVRIRMTKEGLMRSKGKPLAKGYFYTILKNELYAGIIRKFGEVHKGSFTPIISEELFEQVQRVMKYRGRKHSIHITDREDFPLRRFVTNDQGRKLTGSWSKGRNNKYPYYRFGGNGQNFKRDLFEEKYLEFLDNFSFDNRRIKRLEFLVKKHLNKSKDKDKKELEQLKKFANELNERQTTLIQKNFNGIISDEVLKQQLILIDKELMKVNQALAETSTDQLNYLEIIREIENYLRKPSSKWESLPFQSKIKLQWFQFPQGLTYKNNSFGTTEICLFFKLKDTIFDNNSSIVPSGYHNWNQLAKELRELRIILNESDNIGDDNNRLLIACVNYNYKDFVNVS